MRQAVEVDQTCGSTSVEGMESDQFLETQYKKSEFRRASSDRIASDRVSKLMRAIEQDVIPRLVSARSGAVDALPLARDPAELGPERVAQFSRALLGHEAGLDPWSFIGQVRAEGFPVQTLYLGLLAPAARHVGQLWEDDLCTFVDVTLALSALHRILLSLNSEIRFDPGAIDPARRILLVQQSGDTHTFGLQLLATFFRQGAWSVDVTSQLTDKALGGKLIASWFTVVGFSLPCEPAVDELATTIREARRHSANPHLGILIGGPAVAARPDLAALVGADGTAPDAAEAVLEAERFVLRATSVSAETQASRTTPR